MTEETLFQEALSRPAEERAAFLDAACAGEPQLRAAVEALLAAHEKPGNVLGTIPAKPGQPVDSAPGEARGPAMGEFTPEPDESPLPPGAGRGSADPARPLPTTINSYPQVAPGVIIAGRYTLQHKIGEGGMGEVWGAKQTEPVKRKVALKLIKTGMDSRAVLQRFEQERQALGMMDHPNIARVFDGGMTPTGQPFFVMELVHGLPLTKFCDEAKLTPKQRLELFVPICQAVQHAHQKGIIHRDLKPANILVTLIDATPVPKVIDFGVAKATGGKLTDESLSTQFGAIVGTLAYMAPEQAGLSGSDIDTRADIYSLGVILYELLTGLRPIDASRLKKAALAEMIRIIQEEEPSKPSTRLSTNEALPSLAALRQTEPKRLMALLRGELDWVVLKCLEKQRERRYETANGLARDIQRYLADEVVEARPPSAGYRLKKFVRRHKGQVLAASLVLVALLAGIVGTTWGLIEARRQEQIARAESSEKEKARQAEAERAEGERLAKLEAQTRRVEAESQQRRAEAGEKLAGERLVEVEAEKKKTEEEKQIALAVRDFLQNKLLGQADVTAQANDLLKAGSQAAAKKDPTIRELLDRAAGELSEAKIEANFPNQPLLHAEILETVGDTYCGIGEFERAIEFLQRSLALRKAKLGPEHIYTLKSMNQLAIAYQHAGKQDRALPLLKETLKLMKATFGPEDPNTLTTMNNLAAAYQGAGKQDLALPLYEETLKLQRAKLGPEQSDTLMNNLTVAYMDAGKLDLALPLAEETVKLRKVKLGPEHPGTLISMNNLAMVYMAAGKLDRAVPLFEETLKLTKAKLGPEHPDTLRIMNNLATAYGNAGKMDLALPLIEETLKLLKAKVGPDHPTTLVAMNSLAFAYWTTGKRDLALPLYEETLKLRRAKLGPEHPETLTTMINLAAAYVAAGKLDRAKELLSEARKVLPKDSPQLAGQFAMLGLSLLQAKAFTEAEPLLRECLAIREKTQPDLWTTFNTQSLLGGSLLGQKKYAEAEPLLLAGYEGMKQRQKSIPPQGATRIPEALDRLLDLCTATNRPDEVKKWQAERAKYPAAATMSPQKK